MSTLLRFVGFLTKIFFFFFFFLIISFLIILQLSVSAQCCVAVAVDGRVFSWGDQDAASPLLGIGVTSRHVQPTPIEVSL